MRTPSKQIRHLRSTHNLDLPASYRCTGCELEDLIDNDLVDELNWQEEKHGGLVNDDSATRLAVLGAEFGEVCEAITYALRKDPADQDSHKRDLKHELIQTAAVALRWAACLPEPAGARAGMEITRVDITHERSVFEGAGDVSFKRQPADP